MQRFFVLVSILISALAQYPPEFRPEYGAPFPDSYLAPHTQENEVNDAPVDLKVFRHVFVHSVPNDQPQESKIRRIRGPGGDEKHVNIIFVKAPAPAAPDQQIVDLPNDGGRKTLVYVLLKKAVEQPDIQFSGPPPTKPSKPEVYFIRYKDPATPTTTPAPTMFNSILSGYGAPPQEGYRK